MQIDAITPDLAGRVNNHVSTAAASRGVGEPLRIHTVYDEGRAQPKSIVLGDTEPPSRCCDSFRALIEREQ